MVTSLDNGRKCSCKASGDITSSSSITLHVIKAPIVETVDNVFCNNTASVILSCRISGEMSKFGFSQWEHRFHDTYIRSVTGNISGNVSFLAIDSCNYEDNGEYICEAWNQDSKQLFRRKSSISVIVTGSENFNKGLLGWISLTTFLFLVSIILSTLLVYRQRKSMFKAIKQEELLLLYFAAPCETGNANVYNVTASHYEEIDDGYIVPDSTSPSVVPNLTSPSDMNDTEDYQEYQEGQYNLPTIEELWDNTPSKFSWKHTVRFAISEFWNDTFRTEIAQKSTLNRLDTNSIKIDETHPVWNSALNIPGETKRAIVKARILTGTYMLQSYKAKFGIVNVDATCPICFTEDENLIHFITKVHLCVA
ncbi:unnamed protein product [Mytilus edulis]|uniref:Ig-like domain-containing protein n=1 Tax=Mytilus edulis TaxID=6550 RepID=A0A8S3VJM3_MYTED|nr:unnamed protein product [Mytilus edulis]